MYVVLTGESPNNKTSQKGIITRKSSGGHQAKRRKEKKTQALIPSNKGTTHS
jgi:hypothetical protein